MTPAGALYLVVLGVGPFALKIVLASLVLEMDDKVPLHFRNRESQDLGVVEGVAPRPALVGDDLGQGDEGVLAVLVTVVEKNGSGSEKFGLLGEGVF